MDNKYFFIITSVLIAAVAGLYFSPSSSQISHQKQDEIKHSGSLINQVELIDHSGGLSLIKSIGDDRDDYTLLGMSDAVITDKKEIFIVNAGGNFVSRYDWDGNFKGRIGRAGQGPKDFYFPGDIDYYQKKIYVLDNGNRRVACMDIDSNEFDYIKQRPLFNFGSSLLVMAGKRFLGVFQLVEGKRGRIGIMDAEWNVKETFFDGYPIDLGDTSVSSGGEISATQLVRKVILSNYSLPVVAADSERRRFLVSFKSPDNPIAFFVYDEGGKLVKRFNHSLADKRYRFWDFLYHASMETMRKPQTYPRRFELVLDSVAIAGSYYVAFVSLEERIRKEEILSRHRVCLVFNKEGTLKKTFRLEEKNLRIFKYSSGYFMGTVDDDDTERLLIYKMTMD